MPELQGEFAELEKSKHTSRKIRKHKKWFEFGIIALISFGVSLIYTDGKGFQKEIFFVDIMGAINNDTLEFLNINLYAYAAVILTLASAWYLIIAKPRKLTGNPNTENLSRQKKGERSIWGIINSIIFAPFNLLLFTYEDCKKYNFKTSWFYYIEKELLMQKHDKVDEYERVKSLNYLERIFEIYTKNEREEFRQLFKSEESMMDLYRITEGYLIMEDAPKFDDTMKLNKNNFKSFRAFNDRDKVYFSIDYIIFKIQEETENFEKFIKAKMFTGRSRMSRENNENLQMFLSDKKRAEKLVGIGNLEFQNIGAEKLKKLEQKRDEYLAILDSGDMKKIETILLPRLVLYFKFVLTRIILNKYTYIASGTYVSKIADYTTRMIMETYDSKTLVIIDKGRNDGTSDSFEGDTLVNIFLYAYNSYAYGRKKKFLNEINRNLNTDIHDITNDFQIDNMVNDIKKHTDGKTPIFDKNGKHTGFEKS